MKIVHSSEMPWSAAIDHGPFLQRRKELGGRKLSCGLWELAPGKKSFPFHVHHVTEEALFVVSGSGKVRTPEGLTAIGPGDFVHFPAGGPPHQLINDAPQPLVYVAMAAVFGVDVVEYPDSGKAAAAFGEYPAVKRFSFRLADSQVGYFDGEPDK